MSENLDGTERSPALPPPTSNAPPLGSGARQRRGGLGWLMLAIVVAAGGFAYWRLHEAERGRDQSERDEHAAAQQLAEQVQALQRAVDKTQREADALRLRLDDDAKVNESLRGQLLALGERARLAEDAIASLADKRLSGHDALLLNEAELLLVLGGERYALFADPAPTLAAYRLADAALLEANDVAFSGVRETLHAEMDALGALQPASLAQTQSRLTQLRQSVAQLPAARRDAESPGTTSRWWDLLGQVVRVRRESDLDGRLAQDDPMLARALLDVSLRDAQAALMLRDEKRNRQALAAARALVVRDFDAQSPEAKKLLADLDELAQAPIAPSRPEIIGAALRELRNLRATHAMQPAPTPPPPKSPAVQPDGAT